jgi:hypothetical protein
LNEVSINIQFNNKYLLERYFVFGTLFGLPNSNTKFQEDQIMKKLIFTLALSLSLSGAFAFRGMSELNIKMFDNSSFYLVLDNITYNTTQQNYSISELSSGNHFLKVVKLRPYFSGFGYSYQQKTVFSGSIYIPSNMKIFSMISNFNKFIIVSSSALLGTNDAPNEYEPTGYYDNYDDFSSGEEGTSYNGPSGYGYGYSPVIAPANFSALISIISNSSFDSSKQTLAKQAIASNWFTSAQVYQMLKLFTFESSKLAVAKLAYAKTIDKGNYFMVNDAFTFESSIEELSSFICNN